MLLKHFGRGCLVLVVPLGLCAALWQLGYFKLTYESQIVLAPMGEAQKGQISKSLKGQGIYPSAAVRSANEAANTFLKEALSKEKALLQKRISDLDKRKASLGVKLSGLIAERWAAIKGGGTVRLPADWSTRLDAMKTRRAFLVERYPTHTDIPLLGQQIQALETARRQRNTHAASRVTDLGRQIAETQTELRFVAQKTQIGINTAKALQPKWRIIEPAKKPRWPNQVRGGGVALGVAGGGMLLTILLLKIRQPRHREAPRDAIALSLLMPNAQDRRESAAEVLPDDPLSRKAAALYERWWVLTRKVYEPSSEPPKQVFESAQPLLKETAEFMTEGHDALTRHLARTVIEGDLPSHVTRTVLMALLGAYEAGVSSEHQQGMTFAALFHDLSMVPRPGNAWQEIGTEVGRLSSSFVRKIPGLPTALVGLVEAMLVCMDEHGLKVWQNVARDEKLEPFAKLLRQIDRFDKVAQKQKSRLTRRLNAA